MFKKFPSMTNHYNIDEIEKWMFMFPDIKSVEYQITEKIHGANFSIHICPDKPIRYGKRTNFIGLNNNFYSYQEALKDPNIIEFLEDMQDYCTNEGYSYIIFGEIFGQGVQKEVYYGKEKRIRFYDIYDINKNEFFDAANSFGIFESFNVNVPFVADYLSLEEALNYKNDFISKLTPDDYDKKDINICEGIVITPMYKNFINSQGSRFVIKSKNEKFKEKGKAKGVNKKTLENLQMEGIDSRVGELANKAKSYVTKNRLMNVVSHSGLPVDFKNFSFYIKEFIQDYQKDFSNENTKDIELILAEKSPADQKKIIRFIHSVANDEAIKILKQTITGIKEKE